MPKEAELLRVQGVAQMLGVHENTIRTWSNKGILRCVRVGPRKDRRYRRIDVLKLVAQDQPTQPVETPT